MPLQDHDFSIRFIGGHLNCVANGLSRSHVDTVEVTLADSIARLRIAVRKPSETAIDIAPYRLRSSLETKPLMPPVMMRSHSRPNKPYSRNCSASASAEETKETTAHFGLNGEVVGEDESLMSQESQPADVAAPFDDIDSDVAVSHNDLLAAQGCAPPSDDCGETGAPGARGNKCWTTSMHVSGVAWMSEHEKARDCGVVDRHTTAGSPFAGLGVDVLQLPRPDARGNN